MSAVYFIASYDVVDPVRYEAEYVPAVAASLAAAGADVLVASGSADPLEGGPRSHQVVFRFSSRASFRDWYDGADNELLHRVRAETTANVTASLANQFGD